MDRFIDGIGQFYDGFTHLPRDVLLRNKKYGKDKWLRFLWARRIVESRDGDARDVVCQKARDRRDRAELLNNNNNTNNIIDDELRQLIRAT